MRQLKLTGAALLGCVLIALAPVSVAAAKTSGQKYTPLVDCEKNYALTQHYTVAQLRLALKTMPAAEAEYGNCSQIITAALNLMLAQGGSDSGNKHATLGGSSDSSWLVVVVVVVVVALVATGGYLYSRRRYRGGESGNSPPRSI
jgi:hypothetical protein